MKRFIFLFAAFGCVFGAAAYTLVRDTLHDSRIYPGTVHTYSVSIPETASGETALYVGLDGILCNAPEVMDRLNLEGKIPPIVGVYLQPGVVYSRDGEVLRYNRSNEFDATDSLFATFLETELLPKVQQLLDSHVTAKKIQITDNPAGRMIFGLSSGGIAAFTAAWHRPDLFGKVFTGCATLVPMRGGHNLQAWVRKTEPKPLRIMIQDTYHDTWNPLFGSWYEANVLMASALEFAGYDIKTDWTEGVHSVSRSNVIFPAVMEWMWKDGIDSIPRRSTANNFLAPLLDGTGNWEKITTRKLKPEDIELGKAERSDGKLMATKGENTKGENTNFLWQYLRDEDGRWTHGQRYYWLHTADNGPAGVGGMAFDGNGNLWVVTGMGIQICDQNGRVRAILNLPRGIDPSRTALVITDNMVTLLDANGFPAFSRRLNVPGEKPGEAPKSQGAA